MAAARPTTLGSSLQETLDAITARTRALVQPERLAISEAATAALFDSGIEDRILGVGAPAPAFTLDDAATGRPVSSSDLLSLGPLVIKFFRGRWDPYCTTELEAWRDLYPELRRRGAFFVAVSPQTRRQNDFAVQQHRLEFPVLSDPRCELAACFGLAHTVPPASRGYYRSILVNIPFSNSGLTYDTAPDSAWTLPLPALYLVDPTGTVRFAEAHADHKVRPEPDELFKLL